MIDRQRSVEGETITTPLLTILIPSYNRGRRVRALVGFLLPLVDEFSGQIELIVSNNASTDGTEQLFSHISSPYFQLYNRENHLPTAEDNIYNSLELCRGEYVWFLGDDDIPNLDTVRSTITMLEDKHHDFVVFNSYVIDSNGGMTGGWITPLNSTMLEMDFTAGAWALGITFSFAGISNAIQRRDLLTKTDWRPISAQAMIYSHVAWWLVAFKGRRLTVVNKQLVAYRVDDSSIIRDHFSNVATKADVPDYHFWTTGLVDLLIYLEGRGTISPDHVRKMFDYRRDGTYFRFMDNIIGQIHAQVVLTATDGKPRNRLSGVALERMTDWVLRIDPGYFECVEVLNDIFSLRPNPDKDPLPTGHSQSRFYREILKSGHRDRVQRLSEIFVVLTNHKSATTNVYIGMVGRFMDYVIYTHVSGLVAFDEEKPVDRQNMLRRLDIRPNDNTILLGATEPELHSSIRRAREAQTAANLKNQPLATEFAKIAGAIGGVAGGVGAIAAANANVRDDAHFQRAVRNLFATASPKRTRSFIDRLLSRPKPQELPGFDRSFYLRSNPDVALDGTDPVQHFLDQGWKEGRNPSPAFNMEGYLAANTDVAAAGVNPLVHFLNHGQRERRRGWY